MDVLRFSMAGPPRGKGRPKATARNGFVSIYTDAKTRAYEASVSQCARLAMEGRSPFAGALSVSLQFRMPIPASATKRARAAMAANEIPHTSKPDTDNLVKAILDGLESDPTDKAKRKIVFQNDCQITRLFATKIYSENPGVDVRVEPLGEPS
jgi:Holliday junction resolvase RusA-like endonuclease